MLTLVVATGTIIQISVSGIIGTNHCISSLIANLQHLDSFKFFSDIHFALSVDSTILLFAAPIHKFQDIDEYS